MAIPSLLGFSTGEKVTAVKLTDHTKTAIEASVYYAPFCRITNSVIQTLTTGVITGAQYDTTVEDTDLMADLANERIVIKTDGRYRLGAGLSFASGATGTRMVEVMVNGIVKVSLLVNAVIGGFKTAGQLIDPGLHLVAGDLITAQYRQTNGASLATDISSGGCYLSAEWIGQ